MGKYTCPAEFIEEQNYKGDPPTNDLGKKLNWAGWFMKGPMGPELVAHPLVFFQIHVTYYLSTP